MGDSFFHVWTTDGHSTICCTILFILRVFTHGSGQGLFVNFLRESLKEMAVGLALASGHRVLAWGHLCSKRQSWDVRPNPGSHAYHSAQEQGQSRLAALVEVQQPPPSVGILGGHPQGNIPSPGNSSGLNITDKYPPSTPTTWLTSSP